MDWVPVVFLAFKISVFGICMFLAIKWHYDQGRKARAESEKLRASYAQPEAAEPAAAGPEAGDKPRP
ncbi:hypothetical protein Psesu_1415 [Pseudoxanthomonas suwonensis 11-1]|uniref:Uncharacterized protein n=1 Tax=Pseudoxanthomonas suwonensis (strain 11-1) TaxID=743721 RepID=E6WT33_PSEUU|nr:hypothetical protein [Pseudoxanthomonas suwonensis]ADV27262.1 hypothetical protein Psesu_1415 [Pseudoxanthomonas suwonensis 11-1]